QRIGQLVLEARQPLARHPPYIEAGSHAPGQQPHHGERERKRPQKRTAKEPHARLQQYHLYDAHVYIRRSNVRAQCREEPLLAAEALVVEPATDPGERGPRRRPTRRARNSEPAGPWSSVPGP